MLRSFFVCTLIFWSCIIATAQSQRQRISINEHWKFKKLDSSLSDGLFYDLRPAVTDRIDSKVADSKPTERIDAGVSSVALKNWILPTANAFIKDVSLHHTRPAGNPAFNVPYVQATHNDNDWETVDLPHDWAIKGPFYTEENAIIGGGMGRLPVQGVGWYRKKITLPASDKGKTIYLDIDGAMSYAMVWLNGHLVGGWPYGYNSFRLDLTPYLVTGASNQLAIRLDNPAYSARWYPGGGLYRNVWLTKVEPLHIAQWGTFITTPQVTKKKATINLMVDVINNAISNQPIRIETRLFLLDKKGQKTSASVASFNTIKSLLPATSKQRFNQQFTLINPRLWQPLPQQQSSMYVAVTKVFAHNKEIDTYETPFGIRDVQCNAVNGLMVNGTKVRMQGVNQHHDLGALGAAFNKSAAQRQLELLKELGCNAIRMAHNPPAPELLDLTDRMGFLVIDEVFDSWERKKTPHDFHLIFPDWSEADTRSFIRRDRNHPSVIAWSFGNEVGEQYTADTGAAIAKKLYDIVKEEDSTRPATASMNYAKPDMPFPQVMDILSLNYQGEGIRDAPAYAHLRGIRTSPLYPAFHKKFPNKLIVSTETASALSTRDSYIFPVTSGISAPVSDSTGGDPVNKQVSAYELYTAAFGSSADKVFASQDKHPYVAGEFVWSGWDYLGEPTPYYSARSSYCGIIDLAGFKKDRFYLYQSRWLPSYPMVHILPHWNWPQRIGMETPVHIFTSGDEVELFLNGTSLGRKKKDSFDYRLRWDHVIYEPGELIAIAYKNGHKWAQSSVKTTGEPYGLKLEAYSKSITAAKDEMAFITATVVDKNGLTVPTAANDISFSITGPATIVATDNGDPASMVAFPSHSRKAFYGLALAIIKSNGVKGVITIKAQSKNLVPSTISLSAK